ncbi:MAG TPA: hypothetical protein VMF32_25435 [Xanthobacteraceae bacterium]|nr:hypothetical protein [Xanthobacteraceae bacterium]
MPKPAILYRGRQWRITRRYLETLDGRTYYIDKSGLLVLGDRGDGPVYDWPVHLAEKTEWLDLEDFLTAFRRAIDLYGLRFDATIWARTVAEARRIFRECGG